MSYFDLIVLLLLGLAVLKGYRKGLILSLFSLAAFFIGLLAAIKLSAAIASHFKPANHYAPFIAFLLVFVIISWLISLAGRTFKKMAASMMLGWVDKTGGVLFHCLTFCIIISFFLFFAKQLQWLPQEWSKNSVFFKPLEQLGPILMQKTGEIMPFFRDMFSQLTDYFESMAGKISP